ncbi:MAG: hypothetical protein U0W40_04645 [Acidimicrobiia bacterium]
MQRLYNEQLQRDMDAVSPWQGGCSTYYRGPDGASSPSGRTR